MIALNRKMPKNCLECPCMGTYDIPNDKNEIYMFRICHANFLTIYQTTLIQYKENETIQQEWTALPRPKWCPWQEIDTTEHDDEYSWHHSMAGFGGDY